MVLFSFFDNFGKEKYAYMFKVVFVGDATVGKTQIINKFVNNSFSDNYLTTLGVDYKAKCIKYNKKIIKLELYDIAGQERFKFLTQGHCKKANLIVLVYAIDDKNNFKNISSWVNYIKTQKQNAKFLLVGNKCDLKDKRQVSTDEAQKYAEENNMKFIEVSAKTGEGISDDMFNSIILELLEDVKKEEKNSLTYNKPKYIDPKNFDSIQNIGGIKNKKISFCDKYCSCCPCLKKTEGNVEEQEEFEGEGQGDGEDKDHKKSEYQNQHKDVNNLKKQENSKNEEQEEKEDEEPEENKGEEHEEKEGEEPEEKEGKEPEEKEGEEPEEKGGEESGEPENEEEEES